MTAKPKVVAVIQARMNSTRLPGKIMLPLAGAPMLQRLVERVGKAKTVDALVVATTGTSADDPVVDLCSEMGVACHRGSEADVLGRMLYAATPFGADIMVRLTADNPMVGADLVDYLMERFLKAYPDRVYGHTVDGSGFPFGLFAEAAAMDALRAAHGEGDAEECEHVTLFLRRHPERFPALAAQTSRRFTVGHVSVDTQEQYRDVRDLFEKLYLGDPDFGFEALVETAESEVE